MSSIRTTWFFVLLGFISSIVILIYGIYLIRSDVQNITLNKIDIEHDNFEEKISEFSKIQTNLILTLAHNTSIVAYLQDPLSLEQEVEKLFLFTVRSNTPIMQLRFIDKNGQETLRVDRNTDNSVVIIKDENLQNKADRYYVQKFLQLQDGEVSASGFDLNVENGKIQKPNNPTLRIGTPMFKDGSLVGVIIINYYMQNWINNFGRSATSSISLVDQDGYFMLHPDVNWEWSRYLPTPKKAAEYFDVNPNELNLDYFKSAQWLKENVVAEPLEIFGVKTLIVHELLVSQSKLFTQKLLQFGGITLAALLIVLLPLVRLLALYIQKMKEEQKQIIKNEQYLSSLFESTFDSMLVIDINAKIINVNKACLDVFGYSREEMLGKNINMLVPEPHHSQHDAYVKAHGEYERKIVGAERDLHGISKDGTFIPISLAVTQMKINKEIFFIGTLRDLSEIKKVQASEKEKESMLIHQSKLAALGEMLGAIAHQWRQPLNSIGLIMQDLTSAYKYGEVDGVYFKKSEQEILNQLEYMSGTIDEFRNFFTKDQDLTHSNAIDVVGEIRRLYWAQLKAHYITLELLCTNENGKALAYDTLEEKTHKNYNFVSYPNELKQLLLNLVSNAKDAITQLRNPSEIQKNIRIFLHYDEKNIFVEIIDYAGGIPDEVASRIFEPYFTTKENGTGLGLFIANILIQRNLKGSIKYERISLS